MNWLKKLFVEPNISDLKLEVQELKATIAVTRIELFEYLEKVMSPLAKRLQVRISREKKVEEEDLSSHEPIRKSGLMSPSQFKKLKEDGTI